jgi:hypothetical protein
MSVLYSHDRSSFIIASFGPTREDHRFGSTIPNSISGGKVHRQLEEHAQESLADEPVIARTSIADREIPIQRFMSLPPSNRVTGDIESMPLLAGQTVGLVKKFKSAATIVRELVDDATWLIEQRLSVIASG